MKTFKTFVKRLEAPQRNVKINKLIFSFCPGLGREGLR